MKSDAARKATALAVFNRKRVNHFMTVLPFVEGSDKRDLLWHLDAVIGDADGRLPINVDQSVCVRIADAG
jgi:hypothetical protein